MKLMLLSRARFSSWPAIETFGNKPISPRPATRQHTSRSVIPNVVVFSFRALLYSLRRWFRTHSTTDSMDSCYTANSPYFIPEMENLSCVLSAYPRRLTLLSINRIVELLYSLRLNQFMRKVFNYFSPPRLKAGYIWKIGRSKLNIGGD